MLCLAAHRWPDTWVLHGERRHSRTRAQAHTHALPHTSLRSCTDDCSVLESSSQRSHSPSGAMITLHTCTPQQPRSSSAGGTARWLCCGHAQHTQHAVGRLTQRAAAQRTCLEPIFTACSRLVSAASWDNTRWTCCPSSSPAGSPPPSPLMITPDQIIIAARRVCGCVMKKWVCLDHPRWLVTHQSSDTCLPGKQRVTMACAGLSRCEQVWRRRLTADSRSSCAASRVLQKQAKLAPAGHASTEHRGPQP
jgi:hypothetical protein